MSICQYCYGSYSRKSLDAGRCQNCGAPVRLEDPKTVLAQDFATKMEHAALFGVSNRIAGISEPYFGFGK